MESPSITHLTATDVVQLDPYAFLAVLGKRVIHPGGRRSSEELFRRAGFQQDLLVLDVGCGVGTSAIAIARRFGSTVTAAAIMTVSGLVVALLMYETLPSRCVVHLAWEHEPRFGASRPAVSREPGARAAGGKRLMDDVGS